MHKKTQPVNGNGQFSKPPPLYPYIVVKPFSRAFRICPTYPPPPPTGHSAGTNETTKAPTLEKVQCWHQPLSPSRGDSSAAGVARDRLQIPIPLHRPSLSPSCGNLGVARARRDQCPPPIPLHVPSLSPTWRLGYSRRLEGLTSQPPHPSMRRPYALHVETPA